MELKTYLKTNSLTCRDFAGQVNASERAVIKWSRKERFPREEFMKRIVLITNGEVTPNDFFAGRTQ